MTQAVQTFERVAAVHGVALTYARGALSVPLTGLFGQKLYQVRDASGYGIVEYSSHDVVLRADLLVLGGDRTPPQRGDTLTRIVGDRRHVFEVQFPDQSQPPFRWSDPGGALWRIHTALLSDEAVAP